MGNPIKINGKKGKTFGAIVSSMAFIILK